MSDMLLVEKITKARTIPQMIIERIESLVERGQLQPGERLPSEKELASSLGVGRSSVREAVQVLAGMGIVDVVQGKGTFLKVDSQDILRNFVGWAIRIDIDSFDELTEARDVLECQVVELAAQRATEEDIERLRALSDYSTAVGGGGSEPIRTSIDFHVALGQAAKNRMLFHMLNAIKDVIYEQMSSFSRSDAELEVSFSDHRLLVEAIEDRDPERAVRVMREHLQYIKQIYRKYLSNVE